MSILVEADVLILAGGMAGVWAAIAARRAGASVVLAEKGYCGTSGVTATAGPGHWWVPPAERAAAIARLMAQSGGLNDPAWMARAETRGIHRREDRPQADPALARRIRARGLDRAAAFPEGASQPRQVSA